MKLSRSLLALLLASGMHPLAAQENHPPAHQTDQVASSDHEQAFSGETDPSATVAEDPQVIQQEPNAIESCCDDCGHCDSICTDSNCCDDLGCISLVSDRWNFGGHTQIGYYDDNVPLSQADDDLLSFQDNPDDLLLNQQWLYAERIASPTGDWGIGGRMDVVYGVDAQKMQSFGNPKAGVRNRGTFDASLDHGIYGFAIPQLYGEIANEDWSIKIGHFATPLGYEVLPSTGNFFFSHSYTMFNSEPFTHTGVLSTYSGFEGIVMYAGWALGWDTGFDQLNSGNIGIGGFTTEVTEDISFTYLSTFGNFGWRDGGSDNSYSHSIVITTDLTEKSQYVIQSDSLRTNNPGISTFDTIGLNQYLFYSATDRLKLGMRAEWWKADGISFNEVTGGFNYSVLDNLVVRPEWRKDWAPGIGVDDDSFAIDAIVSY